MGGGSSKYKLEHRTAAFQNIDWIADSSMRINPLKKDLFENIEPIGKGKFGLVFLANHTSSRKHVAIKYIPKQIIFETQSIHRIQQEIDTISKLSHPFIVHCFGGFEHSTCFALVFDFAFGGELYNRMKKDHKMSESVAKFYFTEIALVLHYLHDEKKIVYRDLKPENVLLDCHGHVKICDFGFATPLDIEASEGLRDGCGTAMYVAPELAGGFSKSVHGYPVDWWGLGCILYEMIAGDAPFGDSDNMTKFEIFNNINNKNVSFPLMMSSNLKQLLKGLLEKDQKKRSSWKEVSTAQWMADVNFDDVLKKKIMPPWVPSSSKSPSTENFVKWELLLPQAAVMPNVEAYCRSLNISKAQSASGSLGTGLSALSSRSSDSGDSNTPAKGILKRGKSSHIDNNNGSPGRLERRKTSSELVPSSASKKKVRPES